MRRTLIVICGMFALVFALECASRPPPAVAATQEFLHALTFEDCRAMLSLLAAESRTTVEQAARTLPQSSAGSNRDSSISYCRASELSHFRGLSAYGARVVRMTSNEAIVSVERREPTEYFFPGFWATKYDVTIEHVHLVREPDGWKVVLEDST